jgi:hypothetical protein
MGGTGAREGTKERRQGTKGGGGGKEQSRKSRISTLLYPRVFLFPCFCGLIALGAAGNGMEWGCGMTYDMTWYGMGTCRKGNAWPAMAFFLSISAPEAQEPVGLHGLG